jgi:hypothetical protein
MRFKIILVALFTLAATIGISIRLSAERQEATKARLEANLRAAGLKSERPIDHVDRKNPPRLVVSESDYDFGDVSAQADVRHTFTLRNAGPGVLRLKIIERSCTCIAGSLDRDELPPGEEAHLELAVKNEASLEAQVVQGVTIETNDPTQPHIALRLLGRLRRQVWADRDAAVFRDMAPGETRTVPVEILSDWPEGITLGSVRAFPAEVVCEATPIDSASLDQHNAKSGLVLNITCPPKVTDLWGANVVATFQRKGSDEQEEYYLNLEGNRLGRIGVYGMPLDDLGRMKIGNVSRRGHTIQYTVKARGEVKRLVPRAITTTPEFVEATLTPLETAEETGLHRLTLVIPAEAPEGSFQGVNAGSLRLEFENDYPTLNFKLEFAVTNDRAGR